MITCAADTAAGCAHSESALLCNLLSGHVRQSNPVSGLQGPVLAPNAAGHYSTSSGMEHVHAQVGAALSMVYTSGAPIMFCGVGQTYVDLKRLNVRSVVHSLLK